MLLSPALACTCTEGDTKEETHANLHLLDQEKVVLTGMGPHSHCVRFVV